MANTDDAVDWGEGGQRITREGLRDGTLLAATRALAVPAFPVRSDAEIAGSLRATLAERTAEGGVWVFGYGSLMWNPALDFAESQVARLHGWCRRFCLASTGRGTPERPGVMLALDVGGSCRGLAFHIEEPKVETELALLWQREMLSGAYNARWLPVKIDKGVIPALAFVANRKHPRFIGHLGEAEIAARIAISRGPLGSCLDYLRSTIACLEQLGLSDRGLERVRSEVDAYLSGHATN